VLSVISVGGMVGDTVHKGCLGFGGAWREGGGAHDRRRHLFAGQDKSKVASNAIRSERDPRHRSKPVVGTK